MFGANALGDKTYNEHKIHIFTSLVSPLTNLTFFRIWSRNVTSRKIKISLDNLNLINNLMDEMP